MRITLLALLLVSPLPLSATVIYSGEQNLAVAWDDLEGVYINVATGATAVVWPGDFDSSPWINLTLGGYGIFNSELVKPWGITGGGSYDPEQETDHYLNLEEGTVLDSSGPFLESAWGSQFHVAIAAEPGKFLVGEEGFFGFSFQEETGGDTYYGWLRFSPDNNASGTIVDWAFDDTPGQSIEVGAVPEPSGALLTAALGIMAVGTARRRHA